MQSHATQSLPHRRRTTQPSPICFLRLPLLPQCSLVGTRTVLELLDCRNFPSLGHPTEFSFILVDNLDIAGLNHKVFTPDQILRHHCGHGRCTTVKRVRTPHALAGGCPFVECRIFGTFSRTAC